MHGRLRTNVKIGLIILAFSVLVTCAFTGAMLWFGTMANQVQIDNGGIYRLSSTEYAEVVINGGFLQMNAQNLIGTQRYYSEMYHQLLKNLIPVSFVFLTILFLLSLCLWLLLKQIQTKRTFKIAKELNDSITETVLSNEPALAAAYANLKEQFDNRLNDFKRLSSYLTHEQKNEIAILRAKMELKENAEFVEKLDNIADSIDDILTLSDNTDTSPQTVVDVSIICAEVFDNYRKIANNLFFEYEEMKIQKYLQEGGGFTELSQTCWIMQLNMAKGTQSLYQSEQKMAVLLLRFVTMESESPQINRKRSLMSAIESAN